MIILEILFIIFFFAAPIRAKIVLFIIKLLLPDPFLYVDDIIMGYNILTTGVRVVNILEFINEHKFLSTLCGIVGLILAIKFLF